MTVLGTSDTAAALPPGPRGASGWLEALRRIPEPLDMMMMFRRSYGPLSRMPFPGAAMMLVGDPELAEHMLVTDAASYVKDAFLRQMGADVLGLGLLTSEGDLWRRQRRLVQPAFHLARIAEYAGVMVASAEEYAATLRAGQVRDLLQDMSRLTLRAALRALLSVDSESVTTDVSDAFTVIAERYDVGLRSTARALWGLPMPGDRRFRRAVRRLDEIVLEVIRARRAERARKGPPDVLEMLLAARDDDGSGVTEQQLRDEIVTMFSAGHETTALALTFSFLLLSQNPRAEEALHAELDSVLGGRAPTSADLPSLRYAEAVVIEAMRLYPPVYAFGREAIRDAELGGFRVPKGSQLLAAPWVIHRDPETYPEPEAFRPERWLDGLAKRLHRFAYMPFGGGPRKCMGHVFAMTEAPLMLAAIARRFRMRIDVDRGFRPRLVLSITLRPRDPLRARVQAV